MTQSRCHPWSRAFLSLSAAGLALLPTLAAAHPGHYHPDEEDEFDAFTSGLLHPFSGLDHLVLAIAIGWITFSSCKGKARIPLTSFLASLAIGAWTGRGFQSGLVLEIAIAITLLVAGVIFTLGKRPGRETLAMAAALAGMIHGFAHGSEAAPGLSFLFYSAGFIGGTAILLGGGGLIHQAVSKIKQPLAARVAGAALITLGSITIFHAL